MYCEMQMCLLDRLNESVCKHALIASKLIGLASTPHRHREFHHARSETKVIFAELAQRKMALKEHRQAHGC
jgi:hypothetical protein